MRGIGMGLRRHGGVRLAGGGVGWLLRDDFLTAAAAPLTSPRTAEPGPGTLTLVQNDGQFSISGGKLVFPAQTTPTFGDQGFYDSGIVRRAGLTVIGKIRLSTSGNGGFFPIALASGATIAFASYANIDHAAYFAGLVFIVVADAKGTSVGALSINTTYDLAISLRAVGADYFVRGGAFTNWTLLWVTPLGTAATVYPALCNYDSVGTLDNFRVLDLPAPFDTDYGLVSQRTASPSANAEITSMADAIVEYTWTAVTGETVELSTRRTTDADRWIVRGDQAGSTVKLIEVVGGVETERGSAAQTWTNTTAYRIVVIQESTTIRVDVANVLKITYASAATNATATGVKANKAGAELIAWPRVLVGSAAAILDQVSA